MRFFDAGLLLGSAPIDPLTGAAALTVVLTIGAHPITARYDGSESFHASESTIWTANIKP